MRGVFALFTKALPSQEKPKPTKARPSLCESRAFLVFKRRPCLRSSESKAFMYLLLCFAIIMIYDGVGKINLVLLCYPTFLDSHRSMEYVSKIHVCRQTLVLFSIRSTWIPGHSSSCPPFPRLSLKNEGLAFVKKVNI